MAPGRRAGAGRATAAGRVVAVAQGAVAVVVLARLGRGRARRAPLAPPDGAPRPSISAVVPARDEAARIGPCLEGLLADPDLLEVVVVDDGSTDATAALARAAGARVVDAGPPPDGWVGKPWALQRGLEAATGEVVVALDADTRPRPGLARALVAAPETAERPGGALPPAGVEQPPGDGAAAPGRAGPPAGRALVSAGARFDCAGAGERWLHPALLATLVYRYGPPDADSAPRPARLLVNGQCTAVRRRALLDAGGYRHAAGHMTDDAALARGLARRGWRVAFHDGGALLTVDMHDSAAEVWREWGRSIALADVTAPAWRAADLGVVWLTLALPPARVLLALATRRRPARLDVALLALRWSLAALTAPSYARRGPPYWLAPLADPLAAARLTWSALRPSRRWRGRTYG